MKYGSIIIYYNLDALGEVNEKVTKMIENDKKDNATSESKDKFAKSFQ